MGSATGAAELEKYKMFIDFENCATFITAFKNTEKTEVVTRCAFKDTDCRDDENLDAFIARHGGEDATAQYLADCYRKKRYF